MSDNVINKINIGGSTYDIIGVPDGGTAGQVLTKNSETDYDVSWEDAESGGITPITYSELVELRDNSELVPGMQYRITDYTCTTSQKDTRSAGHQFDIIVVADSENTLNENARAAHHTGDTYFANCDLKAWELKYCLDNDTNRFDWACKNGDISRNSYIEGTINEDVRRFYFVQVCTVNIDNTPTEARIYLEDTIRNYDYYCAVTPINPSVGNNAYYMRYSYYDLQQIDSSYTDTFEISSVNSSTLSDGKGVIYYMKDENNNEAPYDFKNIQFIRYCVTDNNYNYHSVGDQFIFQDFSGGDFQPYYFGTKCYVWNRDNNDSINEFVMLDRITQTPYNFEIDYSDSIWVYTFNGCFLDTTNNDNDTIYYDSSTEQKTITHRDGNDEGYNYDVHETENIKNNVIKPCYINNKKQTLNNVVLYSIAFGYGWNYSINGCSNNLIDSNCCYCNISCNSNNIKDSYGVNTSKYSNNNTVQNCTEILIVASSKNYFNSGCSSIIIFGDGNNGGNNNFGTGCHNIKFYMADDNIIGNTCRDIELGWADEGFVIGNECSSISSTGYNKHNTIGSCCSGITFTGQYNSHNTIGKCCSGSFNGNCYNNVIENAYYPNNYSSSSRSRFSFGSNCNVNTIGAGSTAFLGQSCSGNVIGNYTSCLLGDNCSENKIGNKIGFPGTSNNYGLTLGTNCNNNTIDNNHHGLTLNNYCENIHIFDGVSYCTITGGTSSAKVQNAQVLSGTSGTAYNDLVTITFEANKSYTQIAGLNSSGVLKIWNPADLIQ